jgi:hypothetical protein
MKNALRAIVNFFFLPAGNFYRDFTCPQSLVPCPYLGAGSLFQSLEN